MFFFFANRATGRAVALDGFHEVSHCDLSATAVKENEADACHFHQLENLLVEARLFLLLVPRGVFSDFL